MANVDYTGILALGGAQDPTVLGGSEDELERIRNAALGGTAKGARYTQGGVDAANLALGDFGRAVESGGLNASRGMGPTYSGPTAREQVLLGRMGVLGEQAWNAPSKVALVSQQQQDELGRQMIGAASAARGGNQAAALRNAGAAAQDASLVAQQQIAQAQLEETDRRRALQFEAQRATLAGTQAALGLGVQAGAARAGATNQAQQIYQAGLGQYGQLGLGLGQLGLGTEELYSGKEMQANSAQLEADRQYAAAKAAATQQLVSNGAMAVGSLA